MRTSSRCRAAEDVAVIGKAITGLEPIKQRADFEVFLKKFLQSLDLVLPGSAALPYRVPAKRFGYLMRMAKERYKDTSINIAGVGAKVRDLIDEHLVELGINPKIPPTELLDPDFIAGVSAHSHGDGRAKASEMEHAIRKHCTMKFDEDPAFYTRMSEKVEALIQAMARIGKRWRMTTKYSGQSYWRGANRNKASGHERRPSFVKTSCTRFKRSSLGAKREKLGGTAEWPRKRKRIPLDLYP